MPLGELPVALPERRADGVDDDGGGHDVAPPSGRATRVAASRVGSTARVPVVPGSLTRCATWTGRSATAACRCSGQLGVDFERYGEGWVEAAWTPTELAGNPFGIVHGGVYGVIHDAAMNFAANSALASGDRVATLDVSYQTRTRAEGGRRRSSVRGEVTQLTRQVAYTESTVTDTEGAVVSRAMATFIVRRKDP